MASNIEKAIKKFERKISYEQIGLMAHERKINDLKILKRILENAKLGKL